MSALRVATRGSRLALRQVEIVGELLGVRVEPVIIQTLGDRRRDVPLRSIAGQGAFVAEVREALIAGAADIAVHSAKDLPARPDPRLEIVAFPERANPRDALVGTRLADLPRGARVGTGAPRRRAQLLGLRPDLQLAELRGNIDTRLRKGADLDAIVVAAAALDRLTITPDVVDELPVELFVPQVGQGALAIEARYGDPVARFVATIDHELTRVAVTAERTFLAVLGGDCDLPAGAHATVRDGVVHLDAVLADASGDLHRTHARSRHPDHAGTTAATMLRLLVERDTEGAA